MKNIKSMLSSPTRIILFSIVVILLICLIGFSIVSAINSISNNKGIGLEKATEIAIQNAGLNQSDVKGLKGSYDRDDSLECYEIEFFANGFEYDYTISADDGTILKAEKELTDKISGNSSNQAPSDTDMSQGQTGDSTDNSQYISVEKAKEIALNHSKFNSASVTFTKAEMDIENGTHVYEIEFVIDSIEYDYEVNALTGDIIKFDKESIHD